MPFVNTDDLEIKEPLPGWSGRFFHSEHLTFGYYETVAGAALHEHEHPNEEIWQVIEGELEVSIGGRVERAGPGCVAIIPPNTLHWVKVVTSGRVIVTDYPRRDAIGQIKT